MTVVLTVDPDRPEDARDAVARAARALLQGRLVVVPTETVYGIAGRPDDPSATMAIFEAKRRPKGLALPVLAPSAEVAWTIGRPTVVVRELAAAHWPGPLTLVLPRTEHSVPWELGEERDTIAVRVPDHAIARMLMEAAGPIATTSANVSGTAPLHDPEALHETFGESVAVYLVLGDGARRPVGVPSTIVDATTEKMRVVRAGFLDVEKDLAAWRSDRAR